MKQAHKHNLLIVGVWVVVVGAGLYWLWQRSQPAPPAPPPLNAATMAKT